MRAVQLGIVIAVALSSCKKPQDKWTPRPSPLGNITFGRLADWYRTCPDLKLEFYCDRKALTDGKRHCEYEPGDYRLECKEHSDWHVEAFEDTRIFSVCVRGADTADVYRKARTYFPSMNLMLVRYEDPIPDRRLPHLWVDELPHYRKRAVPQRGYRSPEWSPRGDDLIELDYMVLCWRVGIDSWN